ncbi:hypothetical protein CRM22_009001 [Opisthorchis felineus]|uniref:EGF-like domain-containing protein n=1 Tax=Opisthorchis felineus TaxID=147828 RepID=A0A4S2LFS8_OPIFE|nr:hypothetical protein CRM22_009001 [Opisthorchis felineus]
MPEGANRRLSNASGHSNEKQIHQKTENRNSPNPTIELVARADGHNSRLTDSQLTRRKASTGLRCDSPTVSSELGDSRNERTSDNASSNPNNNGATNGNNSSKLFSNRPNTSASLARARKRARSETKRMGLTGSQQSANMALLRHNGTDGSGPEDDDDDIRSVEDERVGPNRPDLAEFDYSLDDLQAATDLDTPLRGRQRRQTYQLPPRRRDSSLGGYGQHSLYGSTGGTLPRRHRGDVSLTRATTIGGVDPHGTLRTANRLAQSIRTGTIPPPPSEPPPATPLSGSIMSELGTAGGNAANLFNPFTLQIHNQQQQQRINAALVAAVASGRLNPQLLNSVNVSGGMPNPYMLTSTTDASQLLQLQQQAALLQHQQQQQQLLAAGLIQPASIQASPYGFGTLGGRRTDPNMIPAVSLYLPTTGLIQTQQHPIYQQHPVSMPMSDLSKLGLLTGGTVLHHHQQKQSDQGDSTLVTTSPGSQAGGGSVVYENSYNSFNRLLSGNVPPSGSQDGLQSMINSGVNLGDGLTLSLNGASQTAHTIPVRQPFGVSDEVTPVTLVHNANPIPPLPPPNHPSCDLNARSMDPTYMTHGGTLGSYGQHKPQVATGTASQDTVVVQAPKSSKRRCPWYYWIISILLLAFLLALVLAISFSAEKQHLGVLLMERFDQDPAIIGLFNPDNPLVKLEPNKPVHIVLERMGVWSAEWRMRTARYVRYNITISSELTSVGLFMRRSTMPTIVNYDLFDRISGRTISPTSRQQRKDKRVKRSPEDTPSYRTHTASGGARETARIHYLDEGIWFLALVNDKPRVETLIFSIGDAIMESGCPNDCSNRGVCNRGNCDCVNGFKGPDCSLAEVPKVCNGHGEYMAGTCRCYPEWKGRECEVLWSECLDPTCSGNGQCVTGECQCYPGFAGELCETKTCISPNCSGHGVCQQGNCRCFSGWSGRACEVSIPVMQTASFLGTPTRRNQPTDSWNPKAASRSATSSPLLLDARDNVPCSLDCGPHGTCVFDSINNMRCQCAAKWTGQRCNQEVCSSSCFAHGHCSNGTCICQPGWNGKHCTLDGCPNQCSGHGQCVFDKLVAAYHCQCASEWKGSACQVQTEVACDDHKDNDQDGLTDCLDPDCCASSHCRALARSSDVSAAEARESCAHSEPFHYRLLITQMAQPGSTFYGNLEFLLRRDRVVVDNLDPRFISVVRGTVRQWDSTPFWGVRVSDQQKMHNGYTLTDEQGRFDLLVEGGSILKLEFLRYPTHQFSAVYHLYVPVNEIVTMGDFYMYDAQFSATIAPGLTSTPNATGGLLAPSPLMHDLWVSGKFVPDDFDDWKTCLQDGVHALTASSGLLVEVERRTDSVGFCVDSTKSLCVNNAGVLSYAIPLHENQLRLIHRTDRAPGYHPMIRVRLLHYMNALPDRLREIHLVLDIAGLREIRRLEPELNLIETFYWNQTDGYNRTVYGLVNAKVSAGFVYTGCPQVFWEHRTVQVEGHELPSSELANWNLNLVHLYSVNHGIVYRGDGLHLFLKHMNWHVFPILGQGDDGARRIPDTCADCDSGQIAFGSATLNLYAVITDALGAVLIGDAAYLRWLQSTDLNKFKPSSASESLDMRAQTIFRENSRYIWRAMNSSQLRFLQPDLDFLSSTRSDVGYYLAPHPNFVISKSIFEMPGSSMSMQFGCFVSHAASKTIWWLADFHHPQPVVSVDCAEQTVFPSLTGLPCLRHPLVGPKGIAVSQNELYFADGDSIWRVPLQASGASGKRTIQLAVGRTESSTGSCILHNQSVPGLRLLLHSPTHLVYSTFEDAIYFVDGPLVYRLHLPTQMVSLIVGYPADCVPTERETSDRRFPQPVTEFLLSQVRGLAISPEGDLYVAEARRVFVRKSDGRLYLVAGKSLGDSETEDQEHEQPSPTKLASSMLRDENTGVVDLGLAQNFGFSNISAIGLSIYGELFVADASHGLVYRIHHHLPQSSSPSSNYRVVSSLTDEAYVFNERGQLIETENAVTQMTLHRLIYRAHTVDGLLSDVRGNTVNLRFRVHRDTHGKLLQLRTPLGFIYNVTLEPHSPQRIQEISNPATRTSWYFRYSPSGLLTHLRRPQDSRFHRFHYNIDSGRLSHIVFPNGKTLDITGLNALGDRVLVRQSSNATPVTAKIPAALLNRQVDLSHHPVQLVYGEPNDRWVAQLSQVYLSLAGSDRPVHLARHLRLPDRKGLASLQNSVVWTFALNSQGTPSESRRFIRKATLPEELATQALGRRVSRLLTVNGHDIIYIKFDWARQLETYHHASTGRVLLQVVYNDNFQPMNFNASTTVSWQDSRRRDFRITDRDDRDDLRPDPSLSGPAPLGVAYTSNGQVSTVNWVNANYQFSYDSMNRLKMAELGSQVDTISFRYTDRQLPYQPSVISMSGLGEFRLFYAEPPRGRDALQDNYRDTASSSFSSSSMASGVLTPSGLIREFSRIAALGVQQLRFNPWPGCPSPWIFEWGTDLLWSASPPDDPISSALLRFIWPSGYRRIQHFPREQQIVFDKTTVKWDSATMEEPEPQLKQLTAAPHLQLIDVMAGYRLTVWRTYRGPLVHTIRLQQSIPGARTAHPDLGGLFDARFVYSYNSNMNLVGLHTQLYSSVSGAGKEGVLEAVRTVRLILDEETLIKYDPVAGQVLSICDLDIVQRPSALYITYAPKSLQLYRHLDDQGRLRQVVLYPLSSRRDPLYNLSLLFRPNSMDVVQREEQRGHVPRWVTLTHTLGGLLKTVEREEAGSSLRSHTELMHNAEGRVARLRIAMSDPQLAGGRIESGSTSRSEELQFIYDARGLLKRRGNWEFVFDEDGFLTERRLHNDYLLDRFAYNSKGLLIWAERRLDLDTQADSTSSSFEHSPVEDDIGFRRAFRVQYVYDAQDRLVLVRDTLIVRDLVQYFYADPRHPSRLTHVFNHGDLASFRFHYDPIQGHLIAIEEFDMLQETDSPPRNSKKSDEPFDPEMLSFSRSQRRQKPKHLYFIITNHEGSPVAMVSESGQTTWTAEYSATGARRLTQPNRNKFLTNSILEDANVPIGYAGCLVDGHTGFVFCPATMRAYDPLGATYTSPDWRGLLTTRLATVYRDPSVLDTHKWGTMEQLSLGIGPAGMSDRLVNAIRSPAWWLKQSGLDVDTILPQLDTCTGTISRSDRLEWELPQVPASFDLTGRLDTMLYRDCGSELLNQKLQRLTVTQPSQLTPGGLEANGLPAFLTGYIVANDWLRLIPSQDVFGPEVTFEVNRHGQVQVFGTPAASSRTVTTSDLPHADVFTSAKLPAILISGARLLDWWTELDDFSGKSLLVQSLARLGQLTTTLKELTELGIKLPVIHSPSDYNLTVHRISSGRSEIWLTRCLIQWRIRFVASWKEAQSQALLDAKNRGSTGAWAHETRMAQGLMRFDSAYAATVDLMADSNAATQLLRLNHLWTYKQLSQLQQSEHLSGYRWVSVISPPENGTALLRLYDDPSTYQLRAFSKAKLDSSG